MMGSLLIVPPLVAAFLLLRGWPAFLFLGAAGFALISTFSVTVVLAQAYLPYRLGMAAGLIVGFAIGAGGIGVTLLGLVADHWGLPVALGLITLMPWAAFVLATRLPEPRRA
jgi:FSR family fosmidomycin resistance protein-like MFS transporter